MIPDAGLSSLFEARADGPSVIGAYMYPFRYFGEPSAAIRDPMQEVEVIAAPDVAGLVVHVTRNGGFFSVIPPEASLRAVDSAPDRLRPVAAAKIVFDERFCAAVNRLICDFALLGVVSEPVTPMFTGAGVLQDNHALVVGAGGGRELYGRALDRVVGFVSSSAVSAMRVAATDPAVVDRVAGQPYSARLGRVAAELPGFIANAYAQFSQGRWATALTDAWIACEQLLHAWWVAYVDTLGARQRMLRLRSDTRTYTAAVRTEILHTAGRVSAELYESLNVARKRRNSLVHGAEVSRAFADETMRALHMALTTELGTSVDPAQAFAGATW